MSRIAKRIMALLVLQTTICLPAFAAQCELPKKLNFAAIPQTNDTQQNPVFQPLLDALQKTLNIPVTTVQTRSYGAIVEGLAAGSIDLALLGPASYVQARKLDAGIIPFVSFIPKSASANSTGESSYYSLLITKTGNGIQSVADLKQKRLTLSDPDSTSGAKIPRQIFSKTLPMPMEQYFSRINFTGKHEQSVLAVINQHTDAAFVASSTIGKMVATGRILPNDLQVLWKSEPIPYDPLVYRQSLCNQIKDKIRAIFFTKNPYLQPLLDNLHATSAIAVTDQHYDIIRQLQ
jgi:phosphonate transport system substrate-binding protein